VKNNDIIAPDKTAIHGPIQIRLQELEEKIKELETK
jgi:hypothetical protein